MTDQPVVAVADDGRLFRMDLTTWSHAVALLSGRPLEAVARERGVAPETLVPLRDRLASAGVRALRLSESVPEPRVQWRGLSALQVSLWRPGPRFTAQAELWRTLTGRTATALVLAVAAAGVLAVLLGPAHPAGAPSLTLLQAVAVLGLVMLLTSLHELGHVLALGAHGLAPRRVGVMLFYGSFAMFSDVTPAWRLTNRWDQVKVILWGSYVTWAEAGVAGLVYATTGSTVARFTFYGLVLTSLLNAVPLARFDGYYLLVLALRRPRLRDEALRTLDARLQGSCSHGPAGTRRLTVFGLG